MMLLPFETGMFAVS